MPWQILARPEGKNPGAEEGKNEGGFVIELALVGGGGAREEVTRVAFERANSSHPDVSFHDQLDHEMGKAKKAIEVLEELTADAGTLQ